MRHRQPPRTLRKTYYNAFSRFYDRFVALHSKDGQSAVRNYLSDLVRVQEGDRILDLCTGTGSLLPFLQERVGMRGFVVGVDFSRGMLAANRQKTGRFGNIHLVEADVAHLPLAPASFDAVTCSHAFYELKGESQDRVLREVVRVLKLGKYFLMMEHDIPQNPLVRVLFHLRVASMGARSALSLLRRENQVLERHFGSVEKHSTPSGGSKIMVCRK